jgi:hypothetical protein
MPQNVYVTWSMNNERWPWYMGNPSYIDQVHRSLFMDHVTFAFSERRTNA